MSERIQRKEALSLILHSLLDEKGSDIFRTTLNPKTGSYSMFWQLSGDYADFLKEVQRVVGNLVPENSPVQISRFSPDSTPLETKSTTDLQDIQPDENTQLISIRARQVTLFYAKGEMGKGPVVGFRTKVDESVLLGAFVRNLSAAQTEPGMVEELLKETTRVMTSPGQH